MRLLNILVIGALILAASFVYKIKFDSTLQAERVAMPVSSTAGARLCLHNDKAPKRDRTGGCKC